MYWIVMFVLFLLVVASEQAISETSGEGKEGEGEGEGEQKEEVGTYSKEGSLTVMVLTS